MKDRISRATALLNLAGMVSTDGDYGVLFVSGGPNGTLTAGCASVLEMTYRTQGEENDKSVSLLQFIGKKRTIDGHDIFASLRKLSPGSVLIAESDNVEEDAERLRIAAEVLFKGRDLLVATCHS